MESVPTLSPSDEKVFQVITEMMTDDEFIKAQLEFMIKNNAIFEDTDENKLEYSPLYEEYLMLTETAIDAKIKQKLELSPEAVDAFYKSLKDENKIKALEALNKDTVDHLYTLVDFNRFKQQMLDSKKAALPTPESDPSVRAAMIAE